MDIKDNVESTVPSPQVGLSWSVGLVEQGSSGQMTINFEEREKTNSTATGT